MIEKFTDGFKMKDYETDVQEQELVALDDVLLHQNSLHNEGNES